MSEAISPSEKLKREMLDIIGKVRALRQTSPGALTHSVAKQLETVSEETKQVEIKSTGTFELETPATPGTVQTISTVKVKTAADKETISEPKKEVSEKIPISPSPTTPSKLAIETKAQAISAEPYFPIGIEVFYQNEEKLDPEVEERLNKIWESFIPRDTICPYCRKPVLTIDNICSHCGALNI
ncbi:MAG: hypothetical protein QXO71_08905 [Candidatus Jordarchaeaceae archaeon]